MPSACRPRSETVPDAPRHESGSTTWLGTSQLQAWARNTRSDRTAPRCATRPKGSRSVAPDRERARIVSVKAAPDGYTLLAASSGPISIMPVLQKTPYDPLKDLAPVSLIARVPFALVTYPSF